MEEMKTDLISHTLKVNRVGALNYISIPSFDRTGLVHNAYSTRTGGVSKGCFSTMNLGLGRGDNKEDVFENYRRLAFATGIYMADTVMCQQVHKDNVVYVDQQLRGTGLLRPLRVMQTDAMITDKRGVCLVTFHADCTPVFLLDPVRKAIGLVHAGWRGTALEIARKTVEKMVKELGCHPQHILAGIGPSIGPCCFEVGDDVKDAFVSVFGSTEELLRHGVYLRNPLIMRSKNEGKYMADLWQANRISLLRAGVPSGNITVTDLCTMHEEAYFHSHRRMGDQRGTQAAFLELV